MTIDKETLRDKINARLTSTGINCYVDNNMWVIGEKGIHITLDNIKDSESYITTLWSVNIRHHEGYDGYQVIKGYYVNNEYSYDNIVNIVVAQVLGYIAMTQKVLA